MNALLDMQVGQTIRVNGVDLRYDGAYDWIPGIAGKQWTIMNDFLDKNGHNRKRGTFSVTGLIDLGIVEAK